jgi:phosphohistidine phosphatase
MEIFLMQHGEAKAKDVDPERGLTVKGERQIASSAKALKRLCVAVDLVVTSTKKRAQQTARIVAKELGYSEAEIVGNKSFNPLSPADEAIGFLEGFKDREQVLVVGHLPSLLEIASALLCEGAKVAIDFKMGGVCRIDCEGLPTHSGVLSWYIRPEQLLQLSR